MVSIEHCASSCEELSDTSGSSMLVGHPSTSTVVEELLTERPIENRISGIRLVLKKIVFNDTRIVLSIDTGAAEP